MSNINGASGSNYISNFELLAWMQTKTDALYGKMSDAMDVSNDRSEAEDALNDIKTKIADVAAGKADGNALYAQVNDAIAKYGAEFPEVADTLGQISQELKAAGAQTPAANSTPLPQQDIPAPPDATRRDGPMTGQVTNPDYTAWQIQYGDEAKKDPRRVIGWTAPTPIKIDEATSTRWQNSIKDQVEAFSKQDQLGLVNIQEYNSQINLAKQTAANLMDAANKTASGIINHIS